MLDRTDTPAAPSTTTDDRFASLFPGEPVPRGPWWRRRIVGIAVVVVVIAVVASVLTATGALGSTASRYRIATVGPHPVAATINSVATIEPVSQATVAFPVAGTVATVDVALGAQVGVGQQLATLDTADLTVTLHDKEQSLADAQLNLSRALNGESVGPSSGGSGGTGSRAGNVPASSATGNPIQLTAAESGPGDATGGVPGDVGAAQQAVLHAQQQVDAALRRAQADLATASSVCVAAGVTNTSGSGAGTGSGPTGGTGSTGSTGSTGDLAACRDAIATVLTDQQAASDAQHALADASNDLDALLDQRAGGATGATGGSGANERGTGGRGTGSSAPTPSSTASSPSAQQLVAYQQAVDAAAAQVAVARQALAQATIISPIAGTVVAVNLTPGATVTAGSSTANIVIQGAGGYEASTNLTIDQVRTVSLHQRALLTPDGSARSLGGQVISIAALPDSTSTSTPTYRVFVALDQPDSPLHNGGTGSLAIVTGQTRDALAVPTSAVTTTGTRHTVQVVDGDRTSTVTVRVGVVGGTWTQVTSGVHAGQTVALADLGRALPSSATDSSNGQTNGLPGGGSFPRFGGAGGPGFFARND